ncbi:Leucine rich repeat containing protein BspA family protein [Entamoeba marina]
MKQLDSYSMMIVSKYFKHQLDYIHMICVCKKFSDILDKFHYNPITVQNTKLFKNMETQHLYTKKSVALYGMYQYVIWYRISYDTYKQNRNKKIIYKRIGFSHKDRFNYNGGIPNDCNMLYDLSCSDFFNNTLIIPNSITDIFPRYFQFNWSLQHLILPTNIRNLLPYSFYMSGIKEIDISFITSIGIHCFRQCHQLSSITITKHLECVGDNCFDYCSNLNTIIVKEPTSCLNCQVPYFFSKCLELQNIICPNIKYTNEDIGRYGIKIPNNCTYLESECFLSQRFVKLSNTKNFIPTTITSLPQYCFEHCYSLTSINCLSVTSFHNCCFFCCSSLTSFNSIKCSTNLQFLGLNSIDKKIENTVNIFENISTIPPKRIENNCFMGCSNLLELNIPNSVTHIGNNCFKGCKSLTSLELLSLNIINGELGCPTRVISLSNIE